MAPEPQKNGRKRFIMTKLTKAQMDALVRESAIATLGVEESGTQIGASTYAIPVEIDGEVVYAKVAITAAQRTDTKAVKAFDLETAVAKYAEEVAAKEEKAAAREAEKAAKLAAKEAKAKAE
jgi:hypothetical protein